MPSTIQITRPHGLGLEQARSRIHAVARRLERELQVVCRWQGNRLWFRRPGATGIILVAEDQVVLEVRLGLWLAPMRQLIADRIDQKLVTALR